jgi:hypothetical protein
MPAPASTDAEFIELYADVGPMEVARRYGITARAVLSRRRRLEQKHRIRINAPEHPKARPVGSHPTRIYIEVATGVVIVGSDGHYWPGPPTTAHRAFVKFIKDMKPRAVIVDGDAFDGSSVSRHPPIGWTKLPTVQEEIEAVQERLHEIKLAVPRGCRTIWPIGNHDWRYESKLATVAPEYAGVEGTSLKHHFPDWEPCLSCWINDSAPHKGDAVVVTHDFKSGVHAPHNNAFHSGRSFITGHLHSSKVDPITDYNGTRFGVDVGMLAEPYGPQFMYAKDNPRPWRSGFCVLTFRDGKLLMPELVTVWDSETVQFRGELIRV